MGVARDAHISAPIALRRFLSRFLVVVVVAIAIEGLVATSKASDEEASHLLYAACLIVANGVLWAGWSYFIRCNRDAEELEPEAMAEAKREDKSSDEDTPRRHLMAAPETPETAPERARDTIGEPTPERAGRGRGTPPAQDLPGSSDGAVKVDTRALGHDTAGLEHDAQRTADSPGSRLPHEHDQALGEVDSEPREVIKQAKRDLDAGMVDTDMRATPGLDAARREQLVPTPDKKA